MAGASLALGAVSTGLSAYGAASNAKTAKAQAQADAARFTQQASLANFNAGEIKKYAAVNKNLVLAVSGVNTGFTSTIVDMNVSVLNATTDFNVGVIKATTDFNVSSAEGAANLLEARAELEANSHRFNADYLELQAQDTLDAGAQAQRQSRTGYAQVKGQQRARMGANGATLDEGSNLRIQADTDYASDVDADTIKTNALKAAMGYRVQSVNEQAAASFASLDGKAASLQKRSEAAAARINGQVTIAQAQLDRDTKTLDLKTTASVQILQTKMNAQIEALNIDNQAEADSWAAKAAALGYTGQAASARSTASAISPFLSGGTSLLAGASTLANQAYNYRQSGAI